MNAYVKLLEMSAYVKVLEMSAYVKGTRNECLPII